MNTQEPPTTAYSALADRLKQMAELLEDTFDYIKEVMPHTYAEGRRCQELRKRKDALFKQE